MGSKIMIFEQIPYRANDANSWRNLGQQVEEYYDPLDDISGLLVGGTNNAHISPIILAAEGINQYMSGHACDATCLGPMADLAGKLGNGVLAKKARSAQETIKAHPGWTSQQVHDFLHDALLVLTDTERSQPADDTGQTHEDFAHAFANWLHVHFPRVEVADITTYLAEKWGQVRQEHPYIWHARQVHILGPQINGEAAYKLLDQCGLDGAQRVKRPRPASAANAPFRYVWVNTIKGPEVVIIRFADSISLIDVGSWREVARVPSDPLSDEDGMWRASQKKQFVIERESLAIIQPRLLRPLPRRLLYLD